MKRILSLCLTVLLLASAMPSMAAGTASATLLNETFNDTITNGMPNSAGLYGDGSLVQAVVPENSAKKILRVRNQWESAIVQFGFSIGANDNVVVEAKMKADDNNSEKIMLEYANNSARFTLVSRKRSGDLFDGGGNKIGNAPVGTWVTLSAVMNLVTLRYELYLNGKLVTHRGILQDPGEMTKVGFTSKPNENKESTLYCDYIRVYTGQEVKAADYFPTAAFNKAAKNTKLEHASEPKYKPSVIFSLDCESNSAGQGVIGMPIWSGSAGIEIDPEDSNHIYRMYMKKGVSALVGAYSRVDSYPCMVIQQDVRVNRSSRQGWTVIARDAAAGGHSPNVIYILPSGKIAAADGTTVLSEKNAKEGWVNIAAAIDFRTKDIDYYIDGELVKEGFPMPNSDKDLSSTLWEVRWGGYGTAATGEHYLDLDNIYLYKSPVYVDKDTLTGSSAAEETGDVIDYELDSSPLTPNMKPFTAVDESLSAEKNPSSYLTDYRAAKKTYDGAICAVAENSNVWVKNAKYNSDYAFYWDGLHMLGPAPTLAAFANEMLSYDEKTKTATIGKVKAKAGDEYITVDGKEYPSESTVSVIDGVLYIPMREFVRYGMHRFYGESMKGFAVIAPDERPYTFKTNAGGEALVYSVADYSHMMAYLILDRYNADTIQSIFDKSIKNKPYPRLLTMKEDAPKLLEATKTDPKAKDYSDITLRDAEGYLNKTLNIPDVPGVQINGIPPVTLPEEMYYAYVATGNTAYLDKVREFAKYLVNMENWNGDAHMLSTSWICLYLANTYDLLYDVLTQEEKDDIVNNVINKGIKYHREYMYGTKWNNWSIMDYNWNVICNAGPMLASMAFLGQGYDDALFLDCLEKGQVSLGYFMHYFSPDGAGQETMGYTNYILSYFIPLLDGFNNYFGDTFGLMDYPGITKVGDFLVNCTGNKNGLAIHDDTSETPPSTALSLWFSKMNKDYEVQRRNVELMEMNQPQKNISGIMLLKYYMPNPPMVDYTDKLDYTYRVLEIATARDGWGDSSQTFMAAHGGYNNCAHHQYDMGNFYFEANGIMWADDLGRENYEINGSPYPMRAEGHNLWVVNPDEGPGQTYAAYTVVKKTESKPKGAIFTADLTPGYYGQVESANRAYMLSQDRKVFTVQDEIKPFEGNNEFYWFWHTTANIEIDEAGKMAWLTKDGKKCAVYFDSNVDFLISKQDQLESLPGSPKVPGSMQLARHKQFRKISINFFSEGEPVYFRAVAVPYGQVYQKTELVPFSEWTIPDGSATEGYDKADAIYLNGHLVEGFSPDVYDYNMYWPGYYGTPEVKVDTKGKVEMIPIDDQNDTMIVRIESSTVPGNYKVYTITLDDKGVAGLPESAVQIPIAGAEASDNDGNIPANVLDDDVSTRWSSANDQWITLDLGEEKEFNTLAFYLYGGDGRRLKYEIYASSDNENFTLVRDDLLSCGVKNEWEHVQFNRTKARYIKLTCHGSTIVPYNSICEARIYDAVQN